MGNAAADLEPHPDLADEQRQVDRAYACLEAMRESAVYLKSLGYLGGNVTEHGVTPEAAAYWELDRQRRVDALSESASALCFGRIDQRGGERWYIGRRHVEDSDGQPVVTDWRAPVATPFYRATVPDPMGLCRRRRFLVEGRHLVDLFDEDLEHPGRREAGAYVPDPLLAEVNRARTGAMRDIVATIQAEQDVIIRAPIERCIVVQGGPGTGKTAVGLHRAAFLLYEHRELLERQRLLVVGPNRIFLRYISQVLPSLGETASVQLTVEGLAGTRYRLGLDDSPTAARVKGDPRMAEVLRRALIDEVGVPASDVAVGSNLLEVRLPAADLEAIVASALARMRKANDTRAVVREQLVELAWRVHSSTRGAELSERESFESELRASPSFKAAVDTIWPARNPAGVLRRLYANRGARHRASNGVLSSDEQDLLARRPSQRVSEERWTRGDLALLDELEDLIGGIIQSYGHIVVDEAQDLSAMELRMIARRARRGSMTVLGDLAQSTSPAAQTRWEDAVVHLSAPQVQIAELTVGYRVPASIMELANRLIPEIAPDLAPTSSVRDSGEAPRLVRVAPEQLAASAASLVERLAQVWVSIAVVVPGSLIGEVATALTAAGVSFVDGQARAALGEHVTLLPPLATKGLEFDAVLVVEPARVVAESPSGKGLLYVVLTRAVQHLTVLHAEPLPEAIA